jgi:predicted TIM-barrel fold metal-dependent hydrolase
MRLSPTKESLLKNIQEFEIIDAHEHLPPERVRVEQKVDVFTLFSNYTPIDLSASGMPWEYRENIYDPGVPIEKRWKMFAPYLKNIRYGSYARPAFIAAKEFYGFNDVNKRNYKALSERMSAENTLGIYPRILRDKCKIRVALTQAKRTDFDLDLLVPLMPLDKYAAVRSKESIEERASDLGERVKTLDDYLELTRKGLEKWKSEGVVGIKMVSSPYGIPSESRAHALFDKLMHEKRLEPSPSSPTSLSPSCPLYSFLLDEMLDMAAEIGLVVAVHTGMWGDFRVLGPQHMIPVLGRHLKTRFDIYHLGIPYVRETAIMGKNFSNVWLNLCWCHIISPRIACQAMDELIDLVPVNKIIAFGGDYSKPVENVYGHLVMARENISEVLGNRIEEGLLTENEAVGIAKRWFYDNPKELYQL